MVFLQKQRQSTLLSSSTLTCKQTVFAFSFLRRVSILDQLAVTHSHPFCSIAVNNSSALFLSLVVKLFFLHYSTQNFLNNFPKILSVLAFSTQMRYVETLEENPRGNKICFEEIYKYPLNMKMKISSSAVPLLLRCTFLFFGGGGLCIFPFF